MNEFIEKNWRGIAVGILFTFAVIEIGDHYNIGRFDTTFSDKVIKSNKKYRFNT